MEWSLSKVMRIESGDVSISPNDLRPLLSLLGVKDGARIDFLVAEARIARGRQRRMWQHRPEFRESMTDALRDLAEYEREACAIRSFSVYYPPSALQIPHYAAALAKAWNTEVSSTALQAMVDIRQLRRETVLGRLNSMRYLMVLDQSVFERFIGGPAVFAEQLRELHDLARRGLVGIRMLSFDLGTPIANNAGFDLISLDGAGEVLHRENGVTEEMIEDAPTTARHRERFEQLWHAANNEVDTIDFIEGRIRALEGRVAERQAHR
jgi:hypothetical protein